MAGMLAGAVPPGQSSSRGPSPPMTSPTVDQPAHSNGFPAQASPKAAVKGVSPGPSSPRGPQPPAAAAVTAPASASPVLADGQEPVQPEAVAEYVKYGELCQVGLCLHASRGAVCCVAVC